MPPPMPLEPQNQQLSYSSATNSQTQSGVPRNYLYVDKQATSSTLSLQRSRADRKFNLVAYGINEHPKGTRRYLHSANDTTAVILILKPIHSLLTEFSVCDCFRLGKYSEHCRRPLLVTQSRSSNVVSILASSCQLSQHPHISITPDLTPGVGKVESVLLKQ